MIDYDRAGEVAQFQRSRAPCRSPAFFFRTRAPRPPVVPCPVLVQSRFRCSDEPAADNAQTVRGVYVTHAYNTYVHGSCFYRDILRHV